MKKTLILAAFGLLASLAPPAFASDSPGTYIDAKAEATLDQQTIKESSTTFVIAKADDMVKGSPGILASAKSVNKSTYRGEKDFYVLTAYDSAPAKLGVITASNDAKIGSSLLKSSTDPAWKTATMTCASAQGASTTAGGLTFTT